jgi:hypothetical protein
MIRVNKDLVEMDTTKVDDLGSKWEQFVPDRPDYPTDYFVENEEDLEEVAQGEDSDDDVTE